MTGVSIKIFIKKKKSTNRYLLYAFIEINEGIRIGREH